MSDDKRESVPNPAFLTLSVSGGQSRVANVGLRTPAIVATSGVFQPVYVPEGEPMPIETRIAQLEVGIRTLEVRSGFQGKRLTQLEDDLL